MGWGGGPRGLGVTQQACTVNSVGLRLAAGPPTAASVGTCAEYLLYRLFGR